MTKVLTFSECPQCAKRGKDRKGDNLAEYPESFYCFSCGYYKPKRNLRALDAIKVEKVRDSITLEKELPIDAIKWLAGYHLTLKEMEGFRYAEKNGNKLLVLAFNDDYWIARNLNDNGLRYLSSGNKPFLKYGDNSEVIIFVEDVISAIKVGRVACAVPMLGAKVAADWWQYTKPYKRVVIWGDKDKAMDNVKIARRTSEMLGREVEVIITEKDPKHYNKTELYNYIYNNK